MQLNQNNLTLLTFLLQPTRANIQPSHFHMSNHAPYPAIATPVILFSPCPQIVDELHFRQARTKHTGHSMQCASIVETSSYYICRACLEVH